MKIKLRALQTVFVPETEQFIEAGTVYEVDRSEAVVDYLVSRHVVARVENEEVAKPAKEQRNGNQ